MKPGLPMSRRTSTEHATFFSTDRAFRDARCGAKDALTKRIFASLNLNKPKQFTAVLMPSMYGPEVGWLRERGVPRRNLFAIEHDPLVHAVLRIPAPRKPLAVEFALDHVPFPTASLVYFDFFGPPNGKHLLAFYKLFKLGMVKRGTRLLATFGMNRGEAFSNNLNKRLDVEAAGQAYIEAAHQRAGGPRIQHVTNHAYTSVVGVHTANFTLTEVRF